MEKKCNCGNVFGIEDVNFYLNTNEEGEEFTEIIVECNRCGFDHLETSDWGHMDLNDVLEFLREEHNFPM